MKSTSYNVQHHVQHTEDLDGLPRLGRVPTSIKEQMPITAAQLSEIAAVRGREYVAALIKTATVLRRTYDAGSPIAVRECVRDVKDWFNCEEGDYQLGVPEGHLHAVIERGERANG